MSDHMWPGHVCYIIIGFAFREFEPLNNSLHLYHLKGGKKKPHPCICMEGFYLDPSDIHHWIKPFGRLFFWAFGSMFTQLCT